MIKLKKQARQSRLDLITPAIEAAAAATTPARTFGSFPAATESPTAISPQTMIAAITRVPRRRSGLAPPLRAAPSWQRRRSPG